MEWEGQNQQQAQGQGQGKALAKAKDKANAKDKSKALAKTLAKVEGKGKGEGQAKRARASPISRLSSVGAQGTRNTAGSTILLMTMLCRKEASWRGPSPVPPIVAAGHVASN